ncbi:MAG: hypothetical protein HOQ28_19935 [Thermoleophilia bacterium]|nr:hypothetical protein [Thermoleophilia bacterium]
MRTLVFLSIVVTSGVLATTAAADGLPVLGIDVGQVGVTVPGSPERIVTINEGRWTLVERIARSGGRVRGFTRVKGTFTIPAVAYDSSASGLSADGKTLVLIEPRRAFPRATTRFALLDARGLGLYRTITLRGDFSFDALSPHGWTMYLVNYTRPSDPTRYSVRAYDLRANRLLPKPIVDPAEHSDKMRGSPITRLMSADGRWAYTLYDGAGSEPFVHALDTARGTAHCIDLEMLAGRADLWSLELRGGAAGKPVRVVSSGSPVAVLDTTTFAASVPRTHGRPWALFIAALLGVLALVTVPAWVRGSDGRARADHRRGAQARRLRPRGRSRGLRVADPRRRG